MERGEYNRQGSGPFRTSIDKYGDMIGERNSSLKPQKDSTEKPSSKARELHKARKDVVRYKESRNTADSVKAQAELELLSARKTVKKLSSSIEESNSKALAQMRDIDKLKKSGRYEEEALDFVTIENTQYAQVMGELEVVKQELSKLKLDVATVLDEKSRAEKEKGASSSRWQSLSSSMELLRKEIDDVNEEQVLVELARLEALKEFEDVKAQRDKEADEFSCAIENTRKRIDQLVEEIERSKDLESKLAITMSDVNVFQNELMVVKEIDKRSRRNGEMEPEARHLLSSINEELEAARKELASIRDEGFQFMTSMDVIRNELKHVKEETSRLKKTQEKSDLTVQNLNSKLLRAKAKLEAVSAAEEKAKSIVSNLSLTFEQLKTETEAAKKEKEQISEETETIKQDIRKAESEIDAREERLLEAMQELEAVKSAEASALENLQSLIESTMKTRASASRHGSSITISTFEYEYLTGRAARAEEIADKKMAAAKAWIEALKASEREITMKSKLAEQEIKEIRIEEEKEVHRADRTLSAKRRVEGELQYWRQKREKNSEAEEIRRKSMKSSGSLTPSRRPKSRKSAASPATGNMNRSTSFTIKRRRKVVPSLAKFFRGKRSPKQL